MRSEHLVDAIDKLAEQENDKTVILSSPGSGDITEKPFNKRLIGIALPLVVALLAGIGYTIWQRPPKSALPVQVSYSYRPTDQLNFRPLLDGSVLHSGDRYQIRFTPEQNGYVYVFQIDSSGAVYRLFPPESAGTAQAGNANPVRAGTAYFSGAGRHGLLRTGRRRSFSAR